MSDRAQRIAFWTAALVLMLVAIYILRTILLPFVAGMAIAYLLDPLADRLERLGLPRMAATIVIVFGFFGMLILVLLLLYPMLAGQINAFIDNIPSLVLRIRDRLMPLVQLLQERFPATNISETASSSAERAVDWGGSALRGLLGSSFALINLLSLLLITPIVTFYMLRDWDRMVESIDSWLPRRHAETIREQAHEIDRVLAGFVRGQGMVCLIQGTFYAVGLSLVGLHFGLVIGLFAGMLSFIPYVGAFLGLFITMAVAVSQFWPDYLWIGVVAAVFALGQFLEGNFVTPKLVGDRVGLHPVWVIFALLAGGALFGFLGMLLAVPAAAVVGVLTRFLIGRYMQSGLYLGQQPPAEP